jgi:anti-sigma regulatory factor (Ser/Thr protein kinase)
MPPQPGMEGARSDGDEQFLISVAQLLESAHLGAFEVEIRTTAGRAQSGVPRSARHSTSSRWWDEREFWDRFSLGNEMLHLEDVASCTVRAASSVHAARLAPMPGRGGDGPPGTALGCAETGAGCAKTSAVCAETSPGCAETSAGCAGSEHGFPAGVSIAGEQPQPPRTLHSVLAADGQAVPAARHLVASFLDGDRAISPRRRADATLIATELVSNAVRHAYEPAEPGAVAIDLSLEGRVLRMLIGDDGRGPRAEPADEAEKRAGLGWLLVAELSDEFIITDRGGGGTLVEVTVGLG